MRRLVLWVGQNVLYWSWFTLWPVWVLRWIRRVHCVPPENLTKIRDECLGAIVVVLFLLTVDAWLLAIIALLVYILGGREILARIDELARKHSKPHLLTGPSRSDEQKRPQI